MKSKFFSKPYRPTAIAGLILLLTLFLPWFTTKGITGIMSYTYIYYGRGDWGGNLTIFMGLAAALLSFIAIPKIRSIGTIVAGILALAGIVVYWVRFREASLQYGIIVATIVSLIVLVIGILDYLKSSRSPKPAQPTQSNPPTTSAPPPQQ